MNSSRDTAFANIRARIMNQKQWNELLAQVRKPTRYLGNEVNVIKKEWQEHQTKVALVFPDLYEIGMSHLGLKILYNIINQKEELLAERVFSPAADLEGLLREKQIPLFSLENKRNLRDFDLVGITLQYEMAYSNILNILDLSDIPFYASERDDSYPLIIGGGSGVANPEPIAPFFDCFLIGDAEESLLKFIEVYRAGKADKLDKRALLSRLAVLEGVYVPAFYDIEYAADGSVLSLQVNQPQVKEKTRRVVIDDLDQVEYPTNFIVPFMDIVHDRLNVEINRGCTRGCRFCQAGMFYRPVRHRKPQTILEYAQKGIEQTGYEDLSLLSLCASDYPQISALLTQLVQDFAAERVSVSLPSLRFDSFYVELARRIKEIKKTGLTFALEAATQRLRNVINKGAGEEELAQLTKKLWELGWRSVKIYFMVGLPTETYEDVQEIPELVRRLKKQKQGRADIKVNVTPFIPKAHTPFQWEPFAPLKQLREKIDFLHHHLRKAVSTNLLELSLLEAVFSRGDRQLAKVLVSAWRNGARFDQWREHFNFSCWQESFAEHGLDIEALASRRFKLDGVLPWDHIDLGITKEFLVLEWQKAERAELTSDCAVHGCQNCGVCDEKMLASVFEKMEEYQPRWRDKKVSANLTMQKIRLKYAKREAASMISHLDLVRLFRRAIRRAGLPVCYSQGFSPQPKIAFGIPLSVGNTSDCEMVDVELMQVVSLAEIEARLSGQMPRGLELVEVKEVSLQEKALTRDANLITYQVAYETSCDSDEIKRLVRELILSTSLPYTRVRGNKIKKINIRPFIKSITLPKDEPNNLMEMKLIFNERGTAKPEEVVNSLGTDKIVRLSGCHRTSIERLWGGSVV